MDRRRLTSSLFILVGLWGVVENATVIFDDSSNRNCVPLSQCPSLQSLSSVDLANRSPCMFRNNEPYYTCPISANSQTTKVDRRKSFKSCPNCLQGDVCPETKLLLLHKKFPQLKQNFKLCGFVGRIPKFCCPSPAEQPAEKPEEKPAEEKETKVITSTIRKKINSSPNPPILTRTSSHNDSEVVDGNEDKKYVWIPEVLCGFANQNRITGGRDSGDHEYPWNVALVYKNSSNSSLILCGGVLISRGEVLTAAHCLSSRDEHFLTGIRLGHASLNETFEVNLKAVSVHPEYNRKPYVMNDLAILHFDFVELGNELRVVCLPELGDEERGEFNVVAGWGLTDTELTPDRLQSLDVDIVQNDDCEKEYRKRQASFSLQPSQLCARGVVAGTDSCRGDSGSPLITFMPEDSRAVLLGITSFGNKKCDSSVPGVYTRISHYLPWIAKATANAREKL